MTRDEALRLKRSNYNANCDCPQCKEIRQVLEETKDDIIEELNQRIRGIEARLTILETK